MALQHHSFWLPDHCLSFTALGRYDDAVAALTKMYPDSPWRHTAVRAARVRDLRPGATSAIAIDGLKNDVRYWDLRRTYGDASRQVLRHLASCAEIQEREENHT